MKFKVKDALDLDWADLVESDPELLDLVVGLLSLPDAPAPQSLEPLDWDTDFILGLPEIDKKPRRD